LNKPRSALRDGTPVLIRRLVVTQPPHTSPCDDADVGAVGKAFGVISDLYDLLDV
jgi:hypothetical protein